MSKVVIVNYSFLFFFKNLSSIIPKLGYWQQKFIIWEYF